MGALRKLQSRVVSFLLALAIVFSGVHPSSAIVDANTNDSSGDGSATSDGTNWNDGNSFIRVTMLFAENGNWKDGKVYQIGRTIDMCNPDAGPSQAVGFVSDFSSKYKTSFGYEITGNTATAYNDGAELKMGNYAYSAWKDYYPVGVINNTPFPVIVGDRDNGVDPKSYFEMDNAVSEVLYATQAAMGITQGNITVDNVKNGVYKNSRGYEVYGQYIILLESGIYVLLNGSYAATTTREALLLKERGSNISSYIASPYKNIANGLYILKPWYMLRLDGSYGANQVSSFWGANTGLLKDKFGVGIVEFKSVERPPNKVVNYYYDLSYDDLANAGIWVTVDEDGNTILTDEQGNLISSSDNVGLDGDKIDNNIDGVGSGSEEVVTNSYIYEYYDDLFSIKADDADAIENSESTYEAPATSTPRQQGGEEYTLVAGYMTNKEIIGGNLSLEGSAGLCLVDISGKVMETITEKIKAKTSNNITTADEVKQWSNSIYLATDSEDNAKVSGLARNRDNIQNIGDGKLSAEFGNGIDSLQAVFLYVKSTVPIPPPTDDDDTDEDITIVVKMYYDSEDAEEPSEVVTDKISIFDTYQVKDEELDGESYKMVEWVMVPDETDGEAEDYKTWEEVKEHQAEGKDNN